MLGLALGLLSGALAEHWNHLESFKYSGFLNPIPRVTQSEVRPAYWNFKDILKSRKVRPPDLELTLQSSGSMLSIL